MKKIIVLNNKCNFTKNEFLRYLKELKKIDYNFILAPSYPYLALVDDITLASQDVSEFYGGSYTGCVSASQLKSLGVKYAIIGHSERIKYFKENSNCLRNKIEKCLQLDITPILCMSETVDIKDGVSNNIVQKLNSVLGKIKKEDRKKVIIAYEPYWAIGTNKLPNKECLEKILSKIKENYKENKILYGGSVNLETINILNNIKDIDGYLIGTLSLYPDELKELVEFV